MTTLNPIYLGLLLLALAFLLAAAALAVWRFLSYREDRRRAAAARSAQRKLDAHRRLPSAHTHRIEAGPPGTLDAVQREVMDWADEHARRSA